MLGCIILRNHGRDVKKVPSKFTYIDEFITFRKLKTWEIAFQTGFVFDIFEKFIQ